MWHFEVCCMRVCCYAARVCVYGLPRLCSPLRYCNCRGPFLCCSVATLWPLFEEADAWSFGHSSLAGRARLTLQIERPVSGRSAASLAFCVEQSRNTLRASPPTATLPRFCLARIACPVIWLVVASGATRWYRPVAGAASPMHPRMPSWSVSRLWDVPWAWLRARWTSTSCVSGMPSSSCRSGAG